MAELMRIECPNCQMEFRVKMAVVPAEGRQATCKCGAKWMVYRTDSPPRPPQPPREPEPEVAPAAPSSPPPSHGVPAQHAGAVPQARPAAPTAAAAAPASPAPAATAPEAQSRAWHVETPEGVLEAQSLYAVRDLIRSGKVMPAYRVCQVGDTEWVEAGSVIDFERYFRLAAHSGAGAATGGVVSCIRHPGVTATHMCSGCGNPYCANCVVPGQDAASGFMTCPQCRSHCTAIERRKEITPFWADVPGLLAYPFRKSGIFMVLICAALFTMAKIALFWGFVFLLFAWAYALHALRKSADGVDHLPEFQDFSDPIEDLVMPAVRLLLASLVSFAPLLIYAVIRGAGGGLFGLVGMFVDPVAWILVLVALTYYPMVVVIVAIYQSIKPAVNPAAVYQAIVNVKREYLIMLGFLAVIFVANVIASVVLSFIPMSLPLEQLVRTYTMFVQFHILGRMVYQTQDRVAWYG